MDYIEILWFIAWWLVSLSFLPQVIKSWKTKSTWDLAISLTIINILGQILWIAYGVSIHSYALVIMSGITLLMTGSLLALKIKHG